MSHSCAYASALARSRLATASSSTLSDACAPGITLLLMFAVETMPHFTGSISVRVSRNGGDRRRHARLCVHGQGPLERLPQDRVHDLAAAARAEARRHRRAQ